MGRKKPLKIHLQKNNTAKMLFFMFGFPQIFLVFLILFLNQQFVKNDKNVFNLAFRHLLFSKFVKCWMPTHIKNSIFNTAAKLKCRKLQYFDQTTKLKCREMQYLGRTTKFKNCFQKLRIKMLRNFHTAKISFLKVQSLLKDFKSDQL